MAPNEEANDDNLESQDAVWHTRMKYIYIYISFLSSYFCTLPILVWKPPKG